MPAPRVINPYQDKPEPTGVGAFFSKLGKDYRDMQDQQEIGNLISQYQTNREDANALEDLFLNIQQRVKSPTKQVEAIKQIKEGQSIVAERDKALNDQVKRMASQNKSIVEEQRKQKARQSLKDAGATEQQLDLYDAASVGGETKIMQDILEDIARNKTPPGLLGGDIEDKDKGLTPKERVDRQEKRFTIQTPLVNKNNETIAALEGEHNSISLLEELDQTGKVGEGVHNLNINPSTGSLLIPKFATAEEQLFVKTVNDFTIKAKDSFGARVTNFELDRFMQRLPTLANSKEGRQLIMRQMKIVNELNQLERKAIQQVFDKYGVRNIDYPDAERMARESIVERKEELRQQYLRLEDVARKNEMEVVNNVKSKVKEGYTAMRKPDGTIKQFPNDNVSALEEKGYKKL